MEIKQGPYLLAVCHSTLVKLKKSNNLLITNLLHMTISSTDLENIRYNERKIKGKNLTQAIFFYIRYFKRLGSAE